MNTEELIIRGASLVIGYLFGMIQTAYILGKANGIDIREHGSGNAGTTNTLRVLGKKAGLIVLLGDLAKTILAVNVIYFLFRESHADEVYMLKLYAALGAILGHNFPAYLKFKGGKGIAAMGGMILSFYWPFIPVGVLTFFGIFALTNYVSLGSLIMSACFFIQMVVMGVMGLGKFADMSMAVRIEMMVVAFIISGMAYVRHSANIGRLIRGEERKTYIFKKNKTEETSDSEKTNE